MPSEAIGHWYRFMLFLALLALLSGSNSNIKAAAEICLQESNSANVSDPCASDADDNSNNEATSSSKFAAAEKLRAHILSGIAGYNAALAPPQSNITTTAVIFLRRINGLNDRLQQLSLQISIHLLWHDARIQWNASEHDNLTMLTVDSEQVWTPHIMLVESVSGRQLQFQESVHVVDDGTMATTTTLTDSFYCELDLYTFPFDKQVCRLTLEARGGVRLAYSEALVKHLYGATRLLDSFLFSVSGEFTLDDDNDDDAMGTKMLTLAENETFAESIKTSILPFRLELKRASRQHLLTTIIPPIILSLTGTLNLYYFSAKGERQNYGACVVVALSVILADLTTNKLPGTTHQAPLIAVLYFGLSMIFMLGTVLLGLPCLLSNLRRLLSPKVEDLLMAEKARRRPADRNCVTLHNTTFVLVFGGQILLIVYVVVGYCYYQRY